MITFEEARQIAEKHIGRDCALIESSIREKPYGWYFQSQSRAYLEIGDFMHLLVGESGFVVERDGGRIFSFGSAPDPWPENYEKGFKFDRHDLTILKIHRLSDTLDLLCKLGIVYVIPGEQNGTIWKIPQRWSRTQLNGRLQHPPCLFPNQPFRGPQINILEALTSSQCCDYNLEEASQKHNIPGYVAPTALK